jgi:hypothetical protein
VLVMMTVWSSDPQFSVKVRVDPITEFVGCVFRSTVHVDVDDSATTIFENRICANAPGHEPAEAFSSSFRIEHVGVLQIATDDGVLIAKLLTIRRDERSLRIILDASKRMW